MIKIFIEKFSDTFWIQFFGFLCLLATGIFNIMSSKHNKQSLKDLNKKADNVVNQVNGRMSELIHGVKDSVPSETVNKIIDSKKDNNNDKQ